MRLNFGNRTGRRRKGGPCSFLALIPIGIICGIIGIGMLISNIALVANGVKTIGTVVDIETKVRTDEAYTDEDGDYHPAETHTSYYPIVEFSTAGGEKVRYTGTFGSSFRPAVGGERAVIYDKGNPSKAQDDSASNLWYLPIGLILFGLLALGAGIIGWIILKRTAKALLGTAQGVQQGGATGMMGMLSSLMGQSDITTAGRSMSAAGAPAIPQIAPATTPTGIPQIAPPSPVNPQLAEYVRGSRAAGVDDATIRKTLIEQGWAAPDVDAGLRG